MSSSVNNAKMYTSGFVDNVMFSHNRANSDDVMFGRVRQMVAPGWITLSPIDLLIYDY